ncbi:extensin family protein [Caldimonas tepidiphila]|uniref:extensin-like domain-containing protein n=1 Tax=Caldimonas tepidiphila TaxID=2315841 RepID=UPI001F0BCBCE|nr:extensin family protein [Caldimonas tepidiphila]
MVGLEHYGSYACRNVYGRTEGRRSRHATADALDVAGFVLADGRRIRVQQHWHEGDDVAARFLREVHRGACRFFDGVLGPGYNVAHRDHLHLERGPSRICR